MYFKTYIYVLLILFLIYFKFLCIIQFTLRSLKTILKKYYLVYIKETLINHFIYIPKHKFPLSPRGKISSFYKIPLHNSAWNYRIHLSFVSLHCILHFSKLYFQCYFYMYSNVCMLPQVVLINLKITKDFFEGIVFKILSVECLYKLI